MPSAVEALSNGVEINGKMHGMPGKPSNDVELSNGVESQLQMHGIQDRPSNGIAFPLGRTTPKSSVWESLYRWLPSRNADCDYWWQQTGSQLATMLLEAGYSVQEQYEGMLFHYYLVVPRLGPCPSPGGSPIYKSPLLHNGVPVAYSWKWNAAGADAMPDVRYTIEAMGPMTGSMNDPLNQTATKELLHNFQLAVPNVDLAWFHDFVNVLYEQAHTTKSRSHPTSTLLLAFEFLKKGMAVKVYFTPENPSQSGTSDLEVWEKAMRGVVTDTTSLDKLMYFLGADIEGSLLRPWMLAIDCVKPSESRIKLYMRTPHTSFDSVRAIMTMGGKIQGPHVDQALDELYELIRLVLGLDKDFPSSAEVPVSEAPPSAGPSSQVDRAVLLSGFTYYFDIAPRASMPDVKFYLPLRLYAKSDLQTAKGLTQWMESHGRGRFTKNYMRIMESLATHRTLEAGSGLQTYIACMIQGSSLSVTTYMTPEANL